MSANTETILRYPVTFNAPVRVQMGLSRSLPAVGHDFSVDLVANDFGTAESPIAISSISQTTTTLTVTTTVAHGLTLGKNIAIIGCLDSRLNYQALVVASVPNRTQFTATAGPNGTINTNTLSGAAAGFVVPRSRIGWARSGTSLMFENATATSGSINIKTGPGDVIPATAGTVLGNQTITVGTTASVIPISANTAYCFQPTTVYSAYIDHESVQWADKAIDSATAALNIRQKREQDVPGPNENFVLQYRANKSPSASNVVCEILTAQKTGPGTATITTNGNHGLVAGNYVTIFGIFYTVNATDFPNVTTAVAISAVTATTFQVSIGTTNTSAGSLQPGGFVCLANGQTTAPGPAAGTTTYITVLNRVGNILYVTGSSTWVGSFVVGDYVNVYGTLSSTFNGPYRVNGISTTVTSLEPLLPANQGADTSASNTGGSIIKRSDLRIHFTRIMGYNREIVEINSTNKGTDVSQSTGVIVNNAVVLSGASNVVQFSSTSTAQTNLAQVGGAVTSNILGQIGTNRALVTATHAPSVIADQAAGTARTTTGTIVVADDAYGCCSAFANVTAVSGTTPTLDISLLESYDNGVTWSNVFHFERITAVGTSFMPAIPIGGRIQWLYAISGTTPSFTFGLSRMRVNAPFPLFRQYFDRTAGVLSGTAAAATAGYNVSGCKTINARVYLATTTTPAAYMPQMSDDSVYFSNVAATATTAFAAGVTNIAVTNASGRFFRLLVTTAGTTQTGNVVCITATS